MRNKTGGDFINAAGATEAVSTSQLMTISNYVIYMYISTAGSAPSNNDYFPNKTETNGR
jgi:hypothetical protein